MDTEEFERWRGEADRALEGGRLQAAAGLHNWACFAAEQAAQLAMKALLHGLGRGPSGIHYGESDAAEALGDAEAVLRFVDETWGGLRG
ncbi:MAG TPA: HEPN domain-containing protein [Actinomycetota bacterium]